MSAFRIARIRLRAGKAAAVLSVAEEEVSREALLTPRELRLFAQRCAQMADEIERGAPLEAPATAAPELDIFG